MKLEVFCGALDDLPELAGDVVSVELLAPAELVCGVEWATELGAAGDDSVRLPEPDVARCCGSWLGARLGVPLLKENGFAADPESPLKSLPKSAPGVTPDVPGSVGWSKAEVELWIVIEGACDLMSPNSVPPRDVPVVAAVEKFS